jgi:general secretion pathway protein D
LTTGQGITGFDNRAGDYRVDVTGLSDPLVEEIGGGLAYVIQKTDRFYAELRALAEKGRANILSSPHVIASDNKEAVINITEEIPIASGTVTTTSAEPVITETVEYRDTGIILRVTPHINDRGLVNLHVSQEVSEQSTEKVSIGTDNPVFLKRSAETDMVVQSGQSVIIGGLIRETTESGKSGVPVLSSIPVVGFLFGYHRERTERVELMFLLTPHVVASIEEADAITQEFKSKLSIIEGQEF